MKILLCGIGAIGSNLAASLTADLKGEHDITLLDFDNVETRNITPGTQFYAPDQVGLSKVEALQFNLYKWYQRKVKILNKNVFDMNYREFDEYDLIIDCFDTNRSRNRTHMYKQLQKDQDQTADVLHVGFSDNFTFAIEWDENYKVPTDIDSKFDICEMPGASAFAKVVGSMGAMVAEAFILEGKKMDIVGGKYTHSVVK